jgi:hypothetical protein
VAGREIGPRHGRRVATRRPRIVAALAASVIAHLCLVGALRLLPRPAPAEDVVAVEIREVPAPLEPHLAPAPPPALQPGAPERPRPPRRVRADRRELRPAPAGPAVPSSSATAEHAGEDETAADGLLRARPGPIDLTPSAAQLRQAGLDAFAAPPAVERRPAAPGFAARLAQVSREDRARAAVAAGKAPPAAFDLSRRAAAAYAPTRAAVARLARAHAGGEHDVGRWLRRYLGGFAARERTEGEPWQTAPQAHALPQARAVRRSALVYASRICVDLRGDRRAVELARSSGAAELDELALAAIRKAAEAPVEGDAGGWDRACYLVSVKLSRVPPTPTISLAVPLQEIVETSVALDGVERSQDLAAAAPCSGPVAGDDTARCLP